MRYGSVCSGIEAATVAWDPLGWEPAFYSDIEQFPRALLKHHYPDVPLHGDFTTIKEKQYGSIELLVGGTPCQSFSVAGLQRGLDDDRGNLALEFLLLAERENPDWLLWENVPGVLSSNEGRDFGAFLGGLAKLGYGFAYRVLNAKYFGVPQERRRVFVVAYRGSWQRAAAVLFEQESLRWHSLPSREQGEDIACFTPASFGDYRKGCGTLTASGGDIGGGSDNLIVHAMHAATINRSDEAGPNGIGAKADTMYTLTASDIHAISIHENQRAEIRTSDISPSLTTGGGKPGQGYPAAMVNGVVRKLMPIECERLQGFPDNYTLIPYRGKPAADGPRYKALGNSMAVPVMHWLGMRIEMVQQLIEKGLI